MATPKTHVPQAAAFGDSATEQIFSKGVLDRDMSGLSYMFLNAAQRDKVADQEAYLNGVREANRIAAALAQQETMSSQAIEMLKQAVKMSTDNGTPNTIMPIMKMLIPDGTDPGAAARLALLQSQANENNAKAAASGKESLPEFVNETQITPSGVSIETQRVKQKGGDSALLQEMARQRALQALKQRGITGSGPGGTGLPNANPVDVSKTLEYNKGRWGQ